MTKVMANSHAVLKGCLEFSGALAGGKLSSARPCRVMPPGRAGSWRRTLARAARAVPTTCSVATAETGLDGPGWVCGVVADNTGTDTAT
ncbi:hypothetical protein [Kitasatospora griseola]|uniref:hypothetical protein n=1 Tax=Kitasatospora griseola TaxID=2064 RepID=UPI00381FFF54